MIIDVFSPWSVLLLQSFIPLMSSKPMKGKVWHGEMKHEAGSLVQTGAIQFENDPAIRCPANRKQDIFTLELETLCYFCHVLPPLE